MLTLIILASLIPGLLAVVQYIENGKKEIEAKANEKEMKSKIDSLSSDNSQMLNQIKELSKDNANLSTQLTETSLLLNENVKGNGELDLWAYPAQNGKIKFRVINNSEFPTYDVKIVIQDYDEIFKCNHSIEGETVYIDTKCFQANSTFAETFNISSGTETELPYLFTVKGEYIHFVFQINTRKKLTIRQAVFKLNLGTFDQSYRIYELQKDKLIFKKEVNPLRLEKGYWDNHFYSQPYLRSKGFE